MNPLIVIAGFIVILAVLIYYLQNRRTEPEKSTIIEEPKPNVIKVRDYEAQYKAEQELEKTNEVQETTEITPEPALEEPETDDIALLTGVGPKYQELLRAAGYQNIKAIAESTPESLYALLIMTNKEKKITKRPPTLRNIEEWIKAATSR